MYTLKGCMRLSHMKKLSIWAFSMAVALPAWSSEIVKLSVDDVIHRVTAQYLVEGIERAEEEGAELVLIQLKTPGGLDMSMREIIEKILNSKVPVVVYVAPSGARAASAGFLITMAADVAAMAPGTNIGAAHPVSGSGQPMDETMSKKVESDAAAYIRSIAAKRGRNVELAEKAVVESQSWTEDEALQAGLIDYVAGSQAELLKELDGVTVTRFDGSETVLHTSGATVEELEMTLPQRILSVVSNPNIAYILMTLGVLGIYFELANPGAVLPGVIGVICLILAFFALQVLPVNYAGLLLILVGIGLLIAEALTPAFGALGLGGVVAVVLGSLILFKEQEIPTPALQLSWAVILPVTLTLVIMFGFIARLVIKAQRSKPTTGDIGLAGEIGTAKSDIDGTGKVFVHGEYWDAKSQYKIAKGDRVRITGVQGLLLDVEPVSKD
jgi:membrane-bound serine protease (ClpP class)